VRPRNGASNLAPALPSTIIGLSRKSKGDQVRDWQRFLLGQRIFAGAVSGTFDNALDRATRIFQTQRKIQIDGDVGPETYGESEKLGFVATAADPGAGGSGDVLRKTMRCESNADAREKAAAALRAANRLKVKGTFDVPGNQNLVAGAKIELTGMLRMSGQYTVDKSAHRMTRSGGYTTSCEVAYV